MARGLLARARELHELGEDWRPLAFEALEAAQDGLDLEQEVQVRTSMASWAVPGEEQFILVQATEALDVLQEQCAESRRQMPLVSMACEALLKLKDEAQALRLARELLRLAQVEGSEVRAPAACQLMRVLLASGKAEEAIQTGQEGLGYCKDDLSRAQLLQYLWQAYGQAKKQQEMTTLCEVSVRLVCSLVSASGRPQAVDLTCAMLGADAPVEQLAQELRDVLKGDACTAPLLYAMAQAAWRQQRAEPCGQWAQEAARGFEEQLEERPAAEALALAVKAQMAQGKFTAARQNGRRARRRFGELGQHEEELQMRLVVARACLEEDERGKRQQRDAVREVEEATKLAGEMGSAELLASSMATYVEVLFEVGHFETCLQVADRILRDVADQEAKSTARLRWNWCMSRSRGSTPQRHMSDWAPRRPMARHRRSARPPQCACCMRQSGPRSSTRGVASTPSPR